MEVDTALPAPAPAQVPTAHPASTPSAPPTHRVQTVPSGSTAPHTPAHPVSSAPPAQPEQKVATFTKITVDPLPTPTASHAPGPVPPSAADEATPAAADPTVTQSPEEKRLTIEIGRLWKEHSEAQANFEKNNNEHAKTEVPFRKSRAELKELRNKLSKLLHELKPLISRPGRGGGWSSFLTKKQIPRATGDSLVRAYQKMLNSEEKSCTTEQITEQPVTERPETVISRYFQGLWPRLSQVVKSPEQVEMFIAVLRETAEKSFAANGESPTSRE